MGIGCGWRVTIGAVVLFVDARVVRMVCVLLVSECGLKAAGNCALF